MRGYLLAVYLVVATIVAFIVLGYLIFAIDKILGRVANRE